MIVKIQIVTDDGTVLVSEAGCAFASFGWEAEGAVLTEGGHELRGFTYLPVPPPRDPCDSLNTAEFRRLYARLRSGG